MISELGQQSAYVWLRLPGADRPVVCGRVEARGVGPDAPHEFLYGRRYRSRSDAIPLVPHDLPLRPGRVGTRRGLHGVLRDAAPDAWGRRVFLHRLGVTEQRADAEVTEVDYLLHRGGAGLGGLAFSAGPDEAPPAGGPTAGLEDLQEAAHAVEQGEAIPDDLADALLHGTSIGGARPKALLDDGGVPAIAKFSSATDVYPVVRLEHLTLELARAAGIQAVTARRTRSLEKDVLVVRRFDQGPEGARHHFFSALTALGLDEMEARYAAYATLADYLRRYAGQPEAQCRELYRRMVFNLLTGNTDDHARNHALFWDGRQVALTPAYDLCALPRVGGEASQAMDVGVMGKRADAVNAVSQCGRFGVAEAEAWRMIREIAECIEDHWEEACREAEIPAQLQKTLWRRTILPPAMTSHRP